MTHEVVEEIAKAASVLYGQVWASLPQWSKELWRESVRHADPAEVRSNMERCSVEAKKAHFEKQAAPVAEPVEKKSRKK